MLEKHVVFGLILLAIAIACIVGLVSLYWFGFTDFLNWRIWKTGVWNCHLLLAAVKTKNSAPDATPEGAFCAYFCSSEEGFEPQFSDSKSGVLPLDDLGMVRLQFYPKFCACVNMSGSTVMGFLLGLQSLYGTADYVPGLVPTCQEKHIVRRCRSIVERYLQLWGYHR